MDFDKVQTGLKEESFVLLDVRGPDEFKKQRIPGSKHLALGQIEGAMAMDDEAFKAKYGFDKPEKSAHVVVHCLKGGRAAKAASTLKDMGYNVEPYSGSMEDWLAKKGPTESG